MTYPLHTDQTDCFDASGRPIACGGTGQDGEYAGRAAGAAGRFAPAGDLVTDRLTGLTWARNAALAEFPLSFPEAQQFVAGLNAAAHAGVTSWALPLRRQLFSLVSHQEINPCLPAGHLFDNVFPGYYWTGTSCARLPRQAWYIHLGGGRVYPGMRHGSCMVWPVATPPAPETVGPRPGTPCRGDLRDPRTRRTWALDPREAAGLVSWSGALEAVAGLNHRRHSGFTDWRLPNIRELEALCDLQRHSPVLAFDGPATIPEGYWSSTTSRYEPRYAWVLYTRDGAVGVGFKPQATFGFLGVRQWRSGER